jgi:hypothetical protein
MAHRTATRRGQVAPRRAIALFALLALPLVPASARGQEPRPRPTASLAWLAGCWERRTSRGAVLEQWMPPAGGMMFGASRTTRGDSVVEYEVLRLFERRDTVVYHAAPSRQQPTEFTTTRVTDTLVVFENAAHDFPQRILYRRGTADSLWARIEGRMNGQDRGIDFRYGRIACTR